MQFRAFVLTVAVAFGGAVAPAAHAAFIAEVGDAGNLPASAQAVALAGFEGIEGTFDPFDSDIDMYSIHLYGSLFATTSGSGAADLGLWLFDSAGRGVAWNACFVNCGVTPQATLDLTGLATGSYFLAVGRATNVPIDAFGFDIFDFAAPGGPLSADPVADWAYFGAVNQDVPVDYRIAMRVPVPEPASGGLLALGLAGAAWARRRRR